MTDVARPLFPGQVVLIGINARLGEPAYRRRLPSGAGQGSSRMAIDDVAPGWRCVS